jgi:hypothetical protein
MFWFCEFCIEIEAVVKGLEST